MILKQIDTKQAVEGWITDHPETSFLQSWEWGEFQRSVGYEPVRFVLEQDGKQTGFIQGFRRRIGFGLAFLSVPRVKHLSGDTLQALIAALKTRGFLFVRIEPEEDMPLVANAIYTHTRQPAQTLLLHLKESEEVILGGMHTKTRYNIRLAQKRGVRIDTQKDAAVFWQLNEETSARDRFKSHDRAYYQNMLDCDLVFQFTAYLENTPIASIICAGFGHTYTYVHGASSDAQRNVMAPFLLQWEAIRYAKARGYVQYDFGGIAPLIDEQHEDAQCHNGRCWPAAHPWSGITRFKVGFGGVYKQYPQAVEVPVRPWLYRLFTFIKQLRSVR